MRNQRIIGIVLICLTFLTYSCDKSKSDWEGATKSNTIEAYDEFSSKHPQSKFVETARQKIEELTWDRTLKDNTIEAYQKFLSEYPQSQSVETARQKIEELTWDRTLKDNTVEAYQKFLSEYTQSKFIETAKEKINAAKREFIRAVLLRIEYKYDDIHSMAFGLPEGAVYYIEGSKSEKTARAHDGKVVEEHGVQLFQVTIDFFTEGRNVVTLTAYFNIGAHEGRIVKTVVDGRWKSLYYYKSPKEIFTSIPNILTRDLQTKRKVAETRDLIILSNGLFSGEELFYEKGELVCISKFVRNTSNGLLVDETVVQGIIPRDYHHYELVLKKWPTGTLGGIIH